MTTTDSAADRLGRLILPALRWSDATGFDHEAPAIARALELGVGGFILFGGPADAVRTLTADLVRRAGRPLLIGADLERGAGQQFAGLTELPPPRALAALVADGGTRALDAIRWAGAVTAHEARGVGVNWVFAPVADLDALADNPIVQTRAFGEDPARVAACVAAWVEGCQAADALACAKHYPGHGRTATDSHAGVPVVAADAATLRAADGAPFDAAIAAGVASLMTAHVAYPALDPTGRPATFSAPILGHLRAAQRFAGLVVTDALIMEGALAGQGEAQAGVEALRAGADILLYPNDVAAVRDALARALATGELAAARVGEALERYERALARATAPAAPDAPRGPFASAAALADAILAGGLRRGDARDAVPALRAPLELAIVDDDVGGPYPASPSDHVARALAAAGLTLGEGGSRIVLAFAEPRAWKGRAGFGEPSRQALAALAPDATLVVLFGHPRLVAEIPGQAPVLVAWHRQRLMQEAVARWIGGTAGGSVPRGAPV
ncbi:MAG TPA: glycoside hydrolase family 3 N-terminal domain-containing protein [Gemmatimonadales bacterium]|nr:glycoside hydrolase family 3 N-terminal domain-containing protein [Gemmatimonadales bacterium]